MKWYTYLCMLQSVVINGIVIYTLPEQVHLEYFHHAVPGKQFECFDTINVCVSHEHAHNPDPDIHRYVRDIESNQEMRIDMKPTWGQIRVTSTTHAEYAERVSKTSSYDIDARYNHGEGVDVYVLDTGVDYAHPEFEGRVDEGADIIQESRGSYNVDCHGHGTHCAGTIGGKNVGMASKVRITGVKTLGCSGSGSTYATLKAVDWVIQTVQRRNRPSIISMSLGGPYSTALNQAIDTAVTKYGILSVVAAGNSDAPISGTSPASSKEALTVGATDGSDNRASFSNYGAELDIYAPGVEIYSTAPQGKYTYMSGTSMACPHVAGVAALYMAVLRNNKQVSAQLIYDSVKNVIPDPKNSANRLLHVLNNPVPVPVNPQPVYPNPANNNPFNPQPVPSPFNPQPVPSPVPHDMDGIYSTIITLIKRLCVLTS